MRAVRVAVGAAEALCFERAREGWRGLEGGRERDKKKKKKKKKKKREEEVEKRASNFFSVVAAPLFDPASVAPWLPHFAIASPSAATTRHLSSPSGGEREGKQTRRRMGELGRSELAKKKEAKKN